MKRSETLRRIVLSIMSRRKSVDEHFSVGKIEVFLCERDRSADRLRQCRSDRLRAIAVEPRGLRRVLRRETA
jgi:hypothetical protein